MTNRNRFNFLFFHLMIGVSHDFSHELQYEQNSRPLVQTRDTVAKTGSWLGNRIRTQLGNPGYWQSGLIRIRNLDFILQTAPNAGWVETADEGCRGHAAGAVRAGSGQIELQHFSLAHLLSHSLTHRALFMFVNKELFLYVYFSWLLLLRYISRHMILNVYPHVSLTHLCTGKHNDRPDEDWAVGRDQGDLDAEGEAG